MIIVITGTSRGIGHNIANYYLNNGDVVIGCSRSSSTIDHPNYTHYVVDLISEDELNSFTKSVSKTFKTIDILINNAGIASMNHFLLTPIETSRRLMNVNFFAPLITIRGFINCLKKSQHPRVINFTTVAVPLNLEGELSYVTSKSAVESMTKVLAKELSTFKITVNAVGPTPVKTALTASITPEKLEKLLNQQAIHRFGEFDDIINVIEFFANPKSDFITGQIIYLGGISH